MPDRPASVNLVFDLVGGDQARHVDGRMIPGSHRVRLAPIHLVVAAVYFRI